MASGEEVQRPSISSSSVGLEALFTAEQAEQASGVGNPELVRLRERLQEWLWQYEPVILWMQRLLVWERPLHSIFVACTLNTVFWLLTSTSLRPIFLLSASVLGLVLLERWKHTLPSLTVQYPDPSVSDRESMAVRPRLLSVPELCHHVAESYLIFIVYIQEMLQYKRLNHGRFCALVCAGCVVLAVVGHYIPGIMISYIILLSVLLWPLVVYHELIQKMYTGLEPILMKLDYSMKGGAQHRKHDKKKVKKEAEEGSELRAETESESEEELSCFAPTVDMKTTALAMAITDSELSDEEASILESGGFSVSRATTPQLTDVSEDLDQQSLNSEPEETFSRDQLEFPSVDEFSSMEPGTPGFRARAPGPDGEAPVDLRGGEPQSPASLLIQHLASPLHFVNTHFNGNRRPPGGESGAVGPGGDDTASAPGGAAASLEALSEEIVSTAISTVVRNTLNSLLHAGEAPVSEESAGQHDEVATETEKAAAVPAGSAAPVCEEEEDFELLDQSELEQMEEAAAAATLDPSSQGQGMDGSRTPPSHLPQES